MKSNFLAIIKKTTQVAVVCFLLFAGSQSAGAMMLLGVYEPDGTVTWSGEWTLRVASMFGHDDRSMVDLGNGTYGVQGWTFYSGYYSSTLPDLLQEFTRNQLIVSPNYDPVPGFSTMWQSDTGWDYGIFFGGASIIDNNAYSTSTLPPIPESIVVPWDKMGLPTNLGFFPGFVGNNYVNYFGDVVQFVPAPAAAVPDGGSTGILLGSVIALFLGAMLVSRRENHAGTSSRAPGRRR